MEQLLNTPAAEVERISQFNEQWDSKYDSANSPFGRYRGYHTYEDTYVWNSLGTEEAKEKLMERMGPIVDEKRKYGYWLAGVKITESNNKTLFIHKYSFDSGD